MSNPTKLIVDLSKPKGQRETVVELTAEEIAKMEARAEEAQAQELAEQEAAEQKALEAESAKQKLLALGLTETEIEAFLN